MSGHSKFHNIKATKDKADAKRSQIFTKIGREIAVAVKMGGADPSTNSKLYDVVQKAKRNNMPNDNIQRSIKKAAGENDGANYESITYEGYGPNGVAFVVECLTDNRNRTAGDVRHIFDRHNGSLGTSGSVLFMFNRMGVVVTEPVAGKTEDDIMEIALENGADDFTMDEDEIVMYCDTQNVKDLSENLTKLGFNVLSAESEFVPNNYVELDAEQGEKIERLYDALDSLDDVQNVYHNGKY